MNKYMQLVRDNVVSDYLKFLQKIHTLDKEQFVAETENIWQEVYEACEAWKSTSSKHLSPVEDVEFFEGILREARLNASAQADAVTVAASHAADKGTGPYAGDDRRAAVGDVKTESVAQALADPLYGERSGNAMLPNTQENVLPQAAEPGATSGAAQTGNTQQSDEQSACEPDTKADSPTASDNAQETAQNTLQDADSTAHEPNTKTGSSTASDKPQKTTQNAPQDADSTAHGTGTSAESSTASSNAQEPTQNAPQDTDSTAHGMGANADSPTVPDNVQEPAQKDPQNAESSATDTDANAGGVTPSASARQHAQEELQSDEGAVHEAPTDADSTATAASAQAIEPSAESDSDGENESRRMSKQFGMNLSNSQKAPSPDESLDGYRSNDAEDGPLCYYIGTCNTTLTTQNTLSIIDDKIAKNGYACVDVKWCVGEEKIELFKKHPEEQEKYVRTLPKEITYDKNGNPVSEESEKKSMQTSHQNQMGQYNTSQQTHNESTPSKGPISRGPLTTKSPKDAD